MIIMPNEFVFSSDYDDFVNQQQAEALAERVFEFDQTKLERDDVSVSGGADNGAARFKKNGSLDKEEFDLFRSKARSAGLTFQTGGSGGGSWKLDNETVDQRIPDPRDVHEKRSTEEKSKDENLRARVTVDPVEFAEDPDRVDYPLIDTPPEFEEEKRGGGISPFAGLLDESEEEMNKF
jgi:hypothetical protein